MIQNRLCFLFCACFLLLPASAVSRAEAERDFIKGDIRTKNQIVKSCGDSVLCERAVKFAIDAHRVLGEDDEVSTLLQTSLDFLSPDSVPSERKSSLAADIGEAFSSFASAGVKIAALDKMQYFRSLQNVAMVNDYLAYRSGISAATLVKTPMDSVSRKAVEVLGIIGNRTSFCTLLTACISDAWPQDDKLLEKSFSDISRGCESDVMDIYQSASAGQKLKLMQILSKNTVISKKCRGEVAQKALSDTIYNTGGISRGFVSQSDADLYVISLETLAAVKWTQAARLATDSFDTARLSFEARQMVSEDFAKCIVHIAEVAADNTGQVLSLYLDFLNKGMEAGKTPVKAVLLSVIKALGGLGDKAAFDYLLYVTYLDYPSDVTKAAKVALAQLKW